MLVIFLISSIGLSFVNEIAYRLVNQDQDRDAQVIELVIPEGTAEKVANGEEVASIPSEMVFIVGDVLVVNNLDSAEHELGPIFVPPGTSARLKLDEADELAMACSFRPSKYLGLTIKAPTNIFTRLEALLYMVPATVVVAFFYSLVIWPISPKNIETELADASVNE